MLFAPMLGRTKPALPLAMSFIYGFAKYERDNISQNELKSLRLLATELLGYGPALLTKAIAADEIVEVNNDG